MKHRTNTALQTVLIMADLMLLWTALFSASQLREALPLGQRLSIEGALAYEWELYISVAGVWLGVTLAFGTYRSGRNRMAYQELGDLLRAVLFSTVVLAGLFYLTTRDVSRLRFWYFILLAFPLLICFRFALRTAYRLVYHRSW